MRLSRRRETSGAVDSCVSALIGFAARSHDAGTVQGMSLSGEVKLISPLTMENIADAAIAEGLTTAEEVSQIVDSLYEYAQDPDTFSGVPRVVQAWGRRPS